jgi:hypothetical protein
MHIEQEPEDAEDILNDSLALLGVQPSPEDDVVRYGPLRLALAPKVTSRSVPPSSVSPISSPPTHIPPPDTMH